VPVDGAVFKTYHVACRHGDGLVSELEMGTPFPHEEKYDVRFPLLRAIMPQDTEIPADGDIPGGKTDNAAQIHFPAKNRLNMIKKPSK
jgi:hypothetical protein